MFLLALHLGPDGASDGAGTSIPANANIIIEVEIAKYRLRFHEALFRDQQRAQA